MDRITKIAENNVAVTPSIILQDPEGHDVEIYQEDKTTYYGQNRIDTEIELYDSQKNLYEDPKWIESQIADCQAQLDKLAIIQEAMDGEEQQKMSAGEPLKPKISPIEEVIQ